jgi:TRAP-type C4-dicarboxylate transport system permease small subunit
MSSLADAHGAPPGRPIDAPPPEPGLLVALRTVDRALGRVEEVVLAAFLLVLLLVGVYGAYKRNIAPPSPFWSEEIIRYAVFFIGLTGAALAAQSDRLFNIDLITRKLTIRGRLILKLAQALFTIVVCYLFFDSALVLRRSLLGEEGELVPPELGVLSLPIAMALIAFHMLVQLLIASYYLVTRGTPPELYIPKVGH